MKLGHSGVLLDWDTAHKITLVTLKDYRRTLKQELKRWRKNPKSSINPGGVWLHPDDVVGNERRLELLTEIIRDFE
jgi:hypothetical protein